MFYRLYLYFGAIDIDYSIISVFKSPGIIKSDAVAVQGRDLNVYG